MTEEQQKPVIKITDHYFTDESILEALKNYYWMYAVEKDNNGFYYREETEI